MPTPGKPLALPVEFVEDRFFVQPKTTDGQMLTLYTDTGGGIFISEAVVRRLKLSVTKVEGDGGELLDRARLPAFSPEASIPPVEDSGGRLWVMPADRAQELEGMLGQVWFKDRVWTFDYPGQMLWLRAPGDIPAHDPTHRVPLGFPVGSNGQRQTNFPRIQIRVDGETIDLLFDTGATVYLTDSALEELDDGRPAQRATSFITQTTFDRWQRKHSGWRVVTEADQTVAGAPMIEVPEIEVAGFLVGPVWFTRRPDAAFHQWMSQWMDKRVDGALGGSALRYFRVTVDYPNAVAIFEK
jgi:hypothetical protein